MCGVGLQCPVGEKEEGGKWGGIHTNVDLMCLLLPGLPVFLVTAVLHTVNYPHSCMTHLMDQSGLQSL